MKPNPLVALNHFTVPTAMLQLPFDPTLQNCGTPKIGDQHGIARAWYPSDAGRDGSATFSSLTTRPTRNRPNDSCCGTAEPTRIYRMSDVAVAVPRVGGQALADGVFMRTGR